MDTREGIDKLVYDKEGNLKFVLQVKPNTFFIGNNNIGLIRDRKAAIEKEQFCKNKYGVRTVYMVYNKETNEFIKNENGGIGFLLSQLIDNEGHTK